ncbi:MAG: hypothetical protein ABJ056_05050 [Halioglobus sp.]
MNSFAVDTMVWLLFGGKCDRELDAFALPIRLWLAGNVHTSLLGLANLSTSEVQWMLRNWDL